MLPGLCVWPKEAMQEKYGPPLGFPNLTLSFTGHVSRLQPLRICPSSPELAASSVGDHLQALALSLISSMKG